MSGLTGKGRAAFKGPNSLRLGMEIWRLKMRAIQCLWVFHYVYWMYIRGEDDANYRPSFTGDMAPSLVPGATVPTMRTGTPIDLEFPVVLGKRICILDHPRISYFA